MVVSPEVMKTLERCTKVALTDAERGRVSDFHEMGVSDVVVAVTKPAMGVAYYDDRDEILAWFSIGRTATVGNSVAVPHWTKTATAIA
jgi:hypothetical protein